MDCKREFLETFDSIALTYPRYAPPIPVGHPSIGKIGEVHGQKRFIIRGMTHRAFNALMKDEERNRIKLYYKYIKYLNPLKSEDGAISSQDDIISARGNGFFQDQFLQKDSITTVSGATSLLYRATGFPIAGTYSNIPSGAIHNADSAGAIPLQPPTSGKIKYLMNFGTRFASGTNVVLLFDLLVAGGNINANVNTAQTITFPNLNRYTDGVGVMMTFEVTTALGSTAANMTVTYTDSGGVTGRTATFAMTTSAIVMRLQPAQFQVSIPYSGVRTVTQVQLSAAMGAGVLALLLFKPLIFIPTLSSTTQVERSIPNMLSGLVPLAVGSDGRMGCLTFSVLTGTTSTGVSNFLVQTIDG